MEKTVQYELQKNIKRVGHIGIPGGGQIVVDGNYAYVGHMKPPHGTTILDVADPKRPKILSMIELPDFYSHTHKVRVVGDLMFTNVEQNDRHFLRISDQLENTRIRLNETLGRQPTDTELADGLGIDSKRLPELEAALKRGYENGGFKIYNISDKYSQNY